MTYIRLDSSFLEHPQFMELRLVSQLPPAPLLGYLMLLSWNTEHAQKVNYSAHEIEVITGCTGRSSLADYLMAVGWAQKHDDVYILQLPDPIRVWSPATVGGRTRSKGALRDSKGRFLARGLTDGN